jgi:large subunit ribosomal protein L32
MVTPRRHSNSRSGKRRGGRPRRPVNLVRCSNCQALKLPHAVCPACGYYKKNLIIPPKTKAQKQKT